MSDPHYWGVPGGFLLRSRHGAGLCGATCDVIAAAGSTFACLVRLSVQARLVWTMWHHQMVSLDAAANYTDRPGVRKNSRYFCRGYWFLRGPKLMLRVRPS